MLACLSALILIVGKIKKDRFIITFEEKTMKAICIENSEVPIKNKYGALIKTVEFLENNEYEYEINNISEYQYYLVKHPDWKFMLNCEVDDFNRYFKDKRIITKEKIEKIEKVRGKIES